MIGMAHPTRHLVAILLLITLPSLISSTASAASVAKVRSVLDLNKIEVSDYPTSLAEIDRAGSVRSVRRNMDVENGDSILTGRANTLVEMNENNRKAFLYSNTAVTFDALNVMAIERGAMFLVNPRGRFEVIRRGLARVLANSTFYVEVTSDGGLLVYVFEGLVTITTSLGSIELATSQAGRATAQGAAERTTLSAADQSRINAEVRGAESVMSSGGGIPGAAVAAIVAGAGVGGYLALKEFGVIDGEPEPEPVADLFVSAKVVSTFQFQDARNVVPSLVYTITVVNLGPDTATGVVVSSVLSSNQIFGAISSTSAGLSCNGGSTVTCNASQLAPDQFLEVVYTTTPNRDTKVPWESQVEVRGNETDPDLGNNVATPQIPVASLSPPTTMSVVLTTALNGYGTGSVGVQIEHNGVAIQSMVATTPSVLRLETGTDENTIVAFPTTPLPEGTVWTFDFSAAPRFVASSFEVTRGQVLSRSNKTISFRMTGASGERLEFRYRLKP